MESRSKYASVDCQTRRKHDLALCDNLTIMEKPATQRLVVLALAAIVVASLAYFASDHSLKWVGHTDLEVTFVVSDATTGQPIPHATIHIRAEPGGFCADPFHPEFSITTDKHGHARQLSTSCLCFGSKGRFQDTFGSHLPRWSYHATADGYEATDRADLDVPENERRVQRGVSFATVSVSIQLRKSSTR